MINDEEEAEEGEAETAKTSEIVKTRMFALLTCRSALAPVRHAFTILFMRLLMYTTRTERMYICIRILYVSSACNISRVPIRSATPRSVFTPLLLEGLLTQQIDLSPRISTYILFSSLSYHIHAFVHLYIRIRTEVTDRIIFTRQDAATRSLLLHKRKTRKILQHTMQTFLSKVYIHILALFAGYFIFTNNRVYL